MSEKTNSPQPDVVVVGGGAAGMLAALFSARGGAQTLLLEKNEKLGKKIYITGKGRCNLTNTAQNEDFFAQVPRNPRFLRSAMSFFDAGSIVELVEANGTITKVERGGRVFPESDKASDVTRALQRALERAGVEIRKNALVEEILPVEGGFQIRLPAEQISCRAVVIATGGMSYPATGSTGDGYRFAERLGHTVTPLRPSLVGMKMAGTWHTLLQGLSLKNVRLVARQGKKLVYSQLGEMLFTHFGISGPLVIELSSHLEFDKPAEVFVDLKPGMTEAELDARLQREFEENRRRQLGSVMGHLLPARMVPVLLQLAEISPEIPLSEVPREIRRKLGMTLKHLDLPVTGLRGMEEAIVTRGGVEVREIVPGTLMSKRLPGLFFTGEVLDVDAHTGGFNLQIAWSTGALAGASAAAMALENGG